MDYSVCGLMPPCYSRVVICCESEGAMRRTVATLLLSGVLALTLGSCGGQESAQNGGQSEAPAASEESPETTSATQESDDDGKLDSREIMQAAFAECPISSREAEHILVGLEHDGVRTVTFGSEFGDFAYTIDVYTGKVLEKSEPEITEEMLANAARITGKEARSAVFDVCPIRSRDAFGMRILDKGDVYLITFNSDYGMFSYTVDAKTGEILEKDEPEVPEDSADAGPSDSDILKEAREACLATLDGYNGGAENMRLTLRGQQYRVVDAQFDWNGKHYEMQYDVSTKTVTTK